jgi:NADPH2:quinone reductase
MRVVEVTRFGGPEVLAVREEPDPTPDRGESLIAVSVVPVLFLETQLRSGWGREWFSQRPPFVPGSGVAGTVTAVGEGVDPGWNGRRVVTDTGEHGGSGGYAEEVTAPVERLIEVPDGVDLRQAAALLHDGRTALRLIEITEIRPDESVLVLGAAGGMGVLLIQLARQAGGHVIAAARGERKLEMLQELGADLVVDYSRPDWHERVRAATAGRGRAGADVVFDGAGGKLGQAAFALTATGGRFSAHGSASGAFAPIDAEEAARRQITVFGIEHVQLDPATAKRLVVKALTLVAAGRLHAVIGQTFPLEQAGAAHAAVEDRDTLGKTLLLTERAG